jgi:hypothetical protein
VARQVLWPEMPVCQGGDGELTGIGKRGSGGGGQNEPYTADRDLRCVISFARLHASGGGLGFGGAVRLRYSSDQGLLVCYLHSHETWNRAYCVGCSECRPMLSGQSRSRSTGTRPRSFFRTAIHSWYVGCADNVREMKDPNGPKYVFFIV